MSLYGLAAFSLVYALAVASPGPGVASVVARALGRAVLGMGLVIVGVLPAVLDGCTLFAPRAHSRLSQPGTVRWVRRGTGAVMAGAAIAVATR